jgi:hypothetical protein
MCSSATAITVCTDIWLRNGEAFFMFNILENGIVWRVRKYHNSCQPNINWAFPLQFALERRLLLNKGKVGSVWARTLFVRLDLLPRPPAVAPETWICLKYRNTFSLALSTYFFIPILLPLSISLPLSLFCFLLFLFLSPPLSPFSLPLAPSHSLSFPLCLSV